MKQPLQLLFVLAFTCAAHLSLRGQGLLAFDNHDLVASDGTIYQAPITDPSGKPLTGSWTAELFRVQAGDLLLPLQPTTVFRSGAAAGFLLSQPVVIEDQPPGGSVRVKVRVWDTRAGSWDNSPMRGESGEFIVTGLGGNIGPIPAPHLNGMRSFSVLPVPEPRILLLAALGIVALLAKTRR